MSNFACPTIYGPAFSPYVRAVRIYADELGLEHLCTMAPSGDKIDFKSEGHLAMNPFGKVPVLLHNDLVLFETPAICRYLEQLAADKGLLMVLDRKEKAMADQWSAAIGQYGGEMLMKGFLLEFAFPKGENGKPRMDVILSNLGNARRFLEIVSQRLQQHAWIAGQHYSMADSILTPFLDYASTVPALDDQGQLVLDNSVLAEYLQRLRSRDSARVLSER